MDEMLRCFAENGYAVVEGALSPEEVTAINDGIDADVGRAPEGMGAWTASGDT